MLDTICSFFPDFVYYLAVSVISTYYYINTLHMKYKEKSNIVYMCVGILILHCLLFGWANENIEQIFELIQIIGEFFIVCMIMKETFRKKLWVYIKLNIYFGISMLSAYVLLKIFVNATELTHYKGSVYIEILNYLIVVIVAYLVFNIAIRIEGAHKSVNKSNFRGIKMTVMCSIAIIGMMYTTAFVYVNVSEEIRSKYMAICLLLIFVIAALCVYINIKMASYEYKEIRLHAMELYKNSVTSISEIVQSEIQYYEKVVKDISEELDDMYSVKNKQALINLIEAKKDKAKKQNIDIVTNVNIMDIKQINNRNVMTRDLVTIVGNLLDNAIEASVHNEISKCKIFVEIEAAENKFNINVVNNYTGILARKDGIFFTTKNCDKANHGLGIENVRETARKYGMDMLIDVVGDKFEVKVL